MAKLRVSVQGEVIDVELYKAMPSGWIASGRYLHRQFTAEGHSPTAAANRWRDAAEKQARKIKR